VRSRASAARPPEARSREVSAGVYYDVSVLPGWMQALARISPATYAPRALRAVAILLGLEIFRRGERYAKRHGKLKRSG